MDRFVAVESFISIVLLFWVYRRWFVPLWVDDFRTEIRMARDDLFDFMWKNSLDFNDAAYRETRQMLNGLLRGSSHISAVSLIWHAWQMRNREIPLAKFRGSPNGILKDKLHTTWDFAAKRMLCLIFMEGITGLIIRALFHCLRAVAFVQRIKDWSLDAGQALMAEACDLGRPNLTATQHLLLR